MSSEIPTKDFQEFEVVGIYPHSHSEEELLRAFRAGNIAIAKGLMMGGEAAANVLRDYGKGNRDIGIALKDLADSKAKSSS